MYVFDEKHSKTNKQTKMRHQFFALLHIFDILNICISACVYLSRHTDRQTDENDKKRESLSPIEIYGGKIRKRFEFFRMGKFCLDIQ